MFSIFGPLGPKVNVGHFGHSFPGNEAHQGFSGAHMGALVPKR